MPKQKTRKSLTRRFRITKTGKVLRRQSFARHLKSKKSSNHLNRLKRTLNVKKSYAKRLKKAMGR